jgi:hypothetical protein
MVDDVAEDDLPSEIRRKLDEFIANAPEGMTTTDVVRQVLAAVFGEEFAHSETVNGLCAFGERYGPQSVVEVLAGAEEELLQAMRGDKPAEREEA